MNASRPEIAWHAAMALLLAGMLCGTALAAEPCLGGAEAARVEKVADARSLALYDGRVLRLAGIEPFDLLRPELGEAENALRQRLAALTEAQAVSVQIVAKAADRYGRHPAMVAVAGALLQETLAREGLAIAFAGGDPLPCYDRILAAEAAARRAGRGFWQQGPLPRATPEALSGRIGGFAIFEGAILTVGNRGARTYLNFGHRWSEDVTGEIDARDRKRFGGEAGLAALAGRRVRLRGYLEEKSGPMLALTSPMQLEVLGDDADGKGSRP